MASNKTGGSKNNATGDNNIDAIAPIANGVIGVGTTPAIPKVRVKKEESKSKIVAIFSSKNINWQGVGSVIKGYNFVSEEASKSWLTRNAVRIASPEEIKANLG